MGDAERGARVRAWIAVGLWTALILILSSDEFSADTTGSWLREVWHWLGLAPRLWPGLHAAVRKSAHLFEYGVLALLALHALRAGGTNGVARAAAFALALVLAVAVLDESRQARSRHRTGSPVDVAVDLAGGAGALALLGLARLGARVREPSRA